MEIKKIFQGIDERLLSDFALTSSQVTHKVKRGETREDLLKGFLSEYLPKKYSISTGEITDTEKLVSHQCDIVIYDQSECPLIFSNENYNVFPCEPVFATIEVKSCLNNKELVDCIKKTKTIKTLSRDNGYIASIVFAFTTSYGKNPIQTISRQLKNASSSLSKHEYIDMICILDSGLIAFFDNISGECAVTENLSERFSQSFFDLAIPNSLFFFVHLLDLLSHQKSIPPKYWHYIGGCEIGTGIIDNW